MTARVSRKRAAPGAEPQPQSLPIGGVNQAFISNDQWNQVPKNSNSTDYMDRVNSPNSSMYNNMAMNAPNQLARRPASQQMINRGGYGGIGSDAWPAATQDLQPNQEEVWANENDDMTQKALQAQRVAAQQRRSIPPFVQKLNNFLDTDRDTTLIHWTADGESFVVEDEDEFARTLIPELFKHNNYASFVRQLNMYGFHKKVGLSDNSMRASERKNKVPSEYYNKHFKRGRPDLLWLIQKPKAAAGKKGTRGKQNGQVGEDDGDEFDLDTPTADRFPDGANTQGGRQPLLIGEGSSAQQKQLSVVHQELQAIRQQQVMISQVIQKLRREHEQLYGQAAAFQDLHNRHENSINAILTFLATVYNRSLEGHGTQQLAALFAGNIPTDTSQPPHGNIVDIGDSFVAEGLANQYNRPPQRRQPLLLKAPPSASNENGMGKVYSTTPTPSPETPTPQTAGRATASPQLNNRSQRNNTPGRTFQQGNATPNMGNVDIMALINSANATDTRNLNNRMNFPEALNHLQTADGKSPLSTMQRNSMLQMIAANNNNNNNNNNNSSTQPSSASSPAFNFTTGPSANNALTSPSPPAFPGPDIQQWKASGDELDFLERTLKEQDDKVAHLSNMLTPLSPSGSIPGLGSSTDYVHLPSDQLDLDQIFNSRDYFTGADSAGTFDFGPGPADFDDNFGLDSANDFTTGDFDGTGNVQGDGHGYGNGAVENGTGGLLDASGSRIVETTESSAATSPSVTVEDVQDGGEEAEGGARKKRKRI